MQVQWFPGHMAKTRRMIGEQMKLIDIVVELLDARLPLSSRNPEIDELTRGKPRLVLLNKADLADEDATKAWLSWFAAEGIPAMSVDAAHAANLNAVVSKIQAVLADKLAERAAKGMAGRTIKVMVVGIPNVGKSSVINKLAGRGSAQVGDRPGVTRSKQWVRLRKGMELLDTPGILWPKFESQAVGRRLAFVGSIKDDILDTEELACYLLAFLRTRYPAQLAARYKLPEDTSGLSDYELLTLVGRKRGFVVSGGEIDTLRAANVLLDEFRGGKLGRITLEHPGEEEEA